MGNGFAFMALAFTAIAANEARLDHGLTTRIASGAAAIAGALSFVGWVLASWLGLPIGGLIWVVSSLLICLWLALVQEIRAAHGPSGSGGDSDGCFRGVGSTGLSLAEASASESLADFVRVD